MKLGSIEINWRHLDSHRTGWSVFRNGCPLATYCPLWRALWLAWKRRNLYTDSDFTLGQLVGWLIAGSLFIYTLSQIFTP